MARVALDAMGGDHAPAAPVGAALLALAELDAEHRVQLVGREEVIREQLEAHVRGPYVAVAASAERIDVFDARDVIEMSERPSAALRGKPGSSMHVGLKLQAERKSDAFVSAGNTGAQMAISAVVLRLHADLARPAIATIFPTARQPVVVLDSGANVDCSAEELVQFARLGAGYAECVLGRRNPVVGLLSIGEEPEKGNAVVKEAHQLLATSGLNFQGNIEGRDLPAGECDRGPIDVVVCDGFVGNVVLKFYEAVAPMILGLLREGGALDPRILADVFKHLDYSEYGGAPLLGVRGISIISHGKSSDRALKNAIKVAARAATSRLDAHIGRYLGERSEGAGSPV
ncbi:MAG TPA: phosphate acyltransferase PlsX [Gemmatimonadaceae bacterium]|nr:phosphate acyltransferase PlsX [Gemmatimonadaceae bacterium]